MPSINDLAFKFPISKKKSLNDKWNDFLSYRGHTLTITSAWGSMTSPLATLTGVTSDIFTLNPTAIVPANTITANSALEFEFMIRRNGANGTNALFAYLGTTNTAADGIIYAIGGVPAIDKRDVRINVRVVSNGTTLTTSYYVATNSLGADNAFRDVTLNINEAADMYFNMGVSSASALDSFDLIGYSIRLLGA